jgi:hypothetical protein
MLLIKHLQLKATFGWSLPNLVAAAVVRLLRFVAVH